MTQEEFIVSDLAMATHQRVVKGSMARAQIRGLDPIGSVAGNGLEERMCPESRGNWRHLPSRWLKNREHSAGDRSVIQHDSVSIGGHAAHSWSEVSSSAT